MINFTRTFSFLFLLFLCFQVMSKFVIADEIVSEEENVRSECKRISNKLVSVSINDSNGRHSSLGTSIFFKR
jgi:Na+-transporting methylmalonyl-CoA/oxaloacetate decarboxylase gamma subunit